MPPVELLELRGVGVSSDGVLFRKGKVLAESFASPGNLENFRREHGGLKFFVDNYLLKRRRTPKGDVVWFVDDWSYMYFHWIADALPRLFVARRNLAGSVLLLPHRYRSLEYVGASLRPFAVEQLNFIDEGEVFFCERLILPTRTAPTGNYNEEIVRDLRNFYADFYKDAGGGAGEKVYVSRGRARRRKITNEQKVVDILREYGFRVVYFEEHAFEQQVRIAREARYLVSNHGAGLANMFFMNPGGSVLELRKKGDGHNNCYFSLASAMNLKYFYQTCDAEDPGADAHAADLIVDERSLRENVELMLADETHSKES